ncbi:MAG: hypothetical protein NW226_01100 [Microscillaceae bacterium]|nr:hypothetical protein [Microscillaceae bacterium]
MSKIIKIYCEGKKGGHDYDILEKVIDGLKVEIKPIGSKLGAKRAIEVYESVVKSDFKLFFRDRDFDNPIPDTVSLTLVKGVYYSHRITIENYLFAPTVFYSFIREKNLTQQYPILDETHAKDVFIKAAKDIKAYQATRHAMGKMRKPTDFGTTWTGGSGNLPDQFDQDYCKQKALEKILKSKGVAENWNEDSFDRERKFFLDKFDDTFFENLGFLVWFQGKDFASALKIHLPEFPIKEYYKFAKKLFDYKQFTDLLELRKILEEA